MRMRAVQPARTRRGFSLVELLVVIGVIATLVSLLLPSLASARESARASVCGSNLRQLASSLHTYAADFRHHAPPGAPHFAANLQRWYGARATVSDAFTSERGPLSAYLGDAGSRVRECPTFAPVADELTARSLGFERSCGGYGYNRLFLGVLRGSERANVSALITDRSGSPLARFASPALTIAFADSALATDAGVRGVVEYSFIEPRFWPHAPGNPAARPDPTIHFRHHARPGATAPGIALAAWLDGHVGPQQRTFTYSSGFYADPAEPNHTGWFGHTDSNELFDFD